MEYRFCLDEVLTEIQDAIRDGYHYGSIEVMEPDDDERDLMRGEGASLWLRVDDFGGKDCVEFDFIESVPLKEVRKYGHKGQSPAPGRPCCKIEE